MDSLSYLRVGLHDSMSTLVAVRKPRTEWKDVVIRVAGSRALAESDIRPLSLSRVLPDIKLPRFSVVAIREQAWPLEVDVSYVGRYKTSSILSSPPQCLQPFQVSAPPHLPPEGRHNCCWVGLIWACRFLDTRCSQPMSSSE